MPNQWRYFFKVVSREQQYYEYNNCHATTGMLGASRAWQPAAQGTVLPAAAPGEIS